MVALTGILLKSQPGQLEALVLRGHAYAQLGDLDVAKRHFGEALRHDPDFQPAQTAFSAVKRLARLKSQASSRVFPHLCLGLFFVPACLLQLLIC